MGKCGMCDRPKDKPKEPPPTMKGQTSSFELTLSSGKAVTLRDMSPLEANAMLLRLGGGTLRNTSA